MRKILIRAGVSPLKRNDADWILQKDRIGANSGNLMYQYSVFRTLMTEDAELTADYFYESNTTPEQMEKINSGYECVVLPLANAFRRDVPLKDLTGFVRQLKIPCVVVGCGVQADSFAQLSEKLPFDEDAKAFVSAVLDRSAMLGLRGEMTAQYLKKLGFVPEKHFTVTGCPSLYTWGADLPEVRLSEMTKDSRISVNTRMKQRKALHQLLGRAIAEHPEYHLVLQKKDELALIRYGVPIFSSASAEKEGNGYYPRNLRHEAVRQGRAIGFVSARDWHDYLREKDFSFGSRIHGNIAAVVSGTPAFVFTTDTRTEELCRYHNIQYMPATQVQEGADIRDIVDRADFTSVHRGHAERFSHYLDFLNANSLPHIYRDTLHPQNVPFDRAEAMLPAGEGVCTGGNVSMADRFKGGYAWREQMMRMGQKAKIVARKKLRL